MAEIIDGKIEESEMYFIAENVFNIEESDIYKNNYKQNGIKSVEFIRLKDDKLLFVEAKSSSRNTKNVHEKFIHSLNLYSSIKAGVNETVLPAAFNVPSKISVSFVLVIKNLQPYFCIKEQQKLIDLLPPYIKKIWRPEVFVINHETAKNRNYAI